MDLCWLLPFLHHPMATMPHAYEIPLKSWHW